MELDFNQMSGVAAYNSGLYEEAVEHFSKAINNNKDLFHWRAYKGRGSAYIKLGQFEKALYDFTMLEKAYEANPKSLNDFGGELYYTKGRIYESIGKIKDAEIDYKKCLELESKNIDCNTSLFNILLSKKDFKGALRILETIIVISPNVEYSNMREKLLKVIKG